MNYSYIHTPVGTLLLAGTEDAVVRILFSQKGHPAQPQSDWVLSPTRALNEAARQLQEYFTGQRRVFSLPLAPQGTAFQRMVWLKLQEIPYGERISYGELARHMGNPKACRAVGAANGANPLPIVVPCHRVVGSNGSLTGFGGGLPVKKLLLELEQGAACFAFAE